ncbi:hypothetical protein T265_00702 [Opisthorchis viverrini]|uniref:Uncharacterized protein n=1 Tax=Opisthorchis viverrini TaxID=6198 RepID=A0A075A502_OPIVI|nr:hypothetical protein T265_00702 [Opisthorchis viverrini]KER33382.1 hypothetical protein T265_00702 [Opisthorchis viverrini]
MRWLGHLLRMPNYRLPKRVVLSMPNSEWRKQRGGQPLTWQRGMKEITKRLGAVGATRLPGWGPRDPHCAWLLSNKSWLYGSEVSVLYTDAVLSMMMMMTMMMMVMITILMMMLVMLLNDDEEEFHSARVEAGTRTSHKCDEPSNVDSVFYRPMCL